MRILLIGDYPHDARLGSTKVLMKLQEEFRTLGHECDVVLADRLGGPANGYVRQAVTPLLALRAARCAVRQTGAYDVIDAASAEALWIARARHFGALEGTAVIARSNGLEQLNYRRMLDDHDAGLLHKPWTRRWFHPLVRLTQVAAAARAADRLIVLNEGDRDFATAHGWKPAGSIDLVPHGVSSVFLESPPPCGQPRRRGILFCGSWTGVKGVTYLAEAYSRMVAAGTDASLTVLGGGVPEAEIRAAFSPAARDRLTILDRVAEPDVMAAYRHHDVLAWPSTYEGFGMVLVEAMSQRLPAVATPVGCARTLVQDNVSGLLVPPRDAPALAAALTRLLDDPALRTQLANRALENVRGMSWTATAKQTLACYELARANGAHARN